MRLLVELSGEHETLPRAELVGALAALGAKRGELERADFEPGVALVETEISPDALARRIALAHDVDLHWATVDARVETILATLAGHDLAGKRFAVRARRVEERHRGISTASLEREAGALLAKTGRVDLDAPEVEVRIVLAARAHVGALAARVDRAAYEARTAAKRPFFAPVALHPRLARALVNLARVAPGARVLDPFCGTGGLALECALAGARVLASDLDARMVAGTRATLAHYGFALADEERGGRGGHAEDAEGRLEDVAGTTVPVSANSAHPPRPPRPPSGVLERIETRDVGEAPEFVGEPVDAIVTDPPYGRASTTHREEMGALYDRFFAAARAALKPGARLATVFPSAAHAARGEKWLTLEQTHEVRVHRSLTRHFAVYLRR